MQNVVEQPPPPKKKKKTLVEKNWENFRGNEVIFIGTHRHDTTKYYKTDPSQN
jgi:hypothetical protein